MYRKIQPVSQLLPGSVQEYLTKSEQLLECFVVRKANTEFIEASTAATVSISSLLPPPADLAIPVGRAGHTLYYYNREHQLLGL